MTNQNERICAHCGRVFSLVYTNRKGYKYLLDTTYCSKSCAQSARVSLTKEQLIDEAKNFINETGRYCTKPEICTGTAHSCKSFVKRGISFTELNEEAGFKKPKSVFQEKVGEFLREEFPDLVEEKTFDGLVGKTGHPLRVDFYIPEINCVVEADGSQHSDPNHPWREWNNGTVKEYDKIKDEFFRKNGIRFYRVPYKKSLKRSDIYPCSD